MAAGRPVVATDVGGAAEAIEHGESGYLVAARDHELMGDYLISLLSKPEDARRMGDHGKRIVNERFSCAKQLQNVERLYTELLTQSVTSAVSGLPHIDSN
jgi:glycosyltransferase involved in cell wall biosynthesis